MENDLSRWCDFYLFHLMRLMLGICGKRAADGTDFDLGSCCFS
ncbi:hypothetical protein BQ1740_0336 [Bacillus subtilis]|nr:hypothetical protein BQ1740_0336 [Bacillus subtilis]